MRESLRWLMESAGLRVKTYASGPEFLDSYDGSMPGCLVMDIRMPGMSGLEVQKELAERDVGIPIIVITAFGEVQTAVKAMKRGAVDFVEKPFSDQSILDSVRTAFDQDVQQREIRSRVTRARELYGTLSPRERQVFKLVVDGKSNRDAAATLGVSPKTIEVHRSHMMKKLGARSLAELVKLSVELGDEATPAKGRKRNSH